MKNKIVLTAAQVSSLSSEYIVNELKKELWHIDSVTIIDDVQMLALISIDSEYISKIDNRFHISSFLLNEFVSQVVVVFSRYLVGDNDRKRELWNLEMKARFLRAMYNKNNIKIIYGIVVVMKASLIRLKFI